MRGSPRRATVAARHAVRRAQPACTPARPSPPRHQAKTPFTRAQAAPKKQDTLIPMNDHKKALAKGERGLKQGIAFSFSPGVGAEGVLIKVM